MVELNIFSDLNKLFCIFTDSAGLEATVETIHNRYDILYKKIFVLESSQSGELICTYNIDSGNMAINSLMPNTILLHRKKDSNTLYTINALNALIRSLNNGYLDKSYQVKWVEYKNCVLLNNGPELRRLDTKIHRIVNL
jgi:hypothetical protein